MRKLSEIRDLNSDASKIGLDMEYINFCVEFNTIIAEIFEALHLKNPALLQLLNIPMAKNINAKIVSRGNKTYKQCLDYFKTHIVNYNLEVKVDDIERKMNELKLTNKFYHKKGIYSDLEAKMKSYNDLLLSLIE